MRRMGLAVVLMALLLPAAATASPRAVVSRTRHLHPGVPVTFRLEVVPRVALFEADIYIDGKRVEQEVAGLSIWAHRGSVSVEVTGSRKRAPLVVHAIAWNGSHRVTVRSWWRSDR